MTNVILAVLMVISIASWGILLYSDWKWNKAMDERRSRDRYNNMLNDEFDYGHNVNHNSED